MKYFLMLSTLFLVLNVEARVSFSNALREINKRSTDIPPVIAGVEAAEHFQLSKKLKFVPSLAAGYSKSEEFTYSSNTDSLFLKSSFNIFNGGSDYADYQAGSYNLFASQAKLGKVVLALENKATVVIVDYLQKSIDKNIYQSIYKTKVKSLRATRRRFKKGLTPRQEVLKSQVDLGISKAQLNSSKISSFLSRSKLVNLLGHSQLAVRWPLKNKLKRLNLKRLKSSKLNFDSRPDLLEAKYQMMRDQNNLKSVKRSFLPKIDFFYTMSANTSNSVESDTRTSLLTISIPLFSNWQTYSSYKTAQTTFSSSNYNYKSKMRSAEAEWDALKQNLADSIHTAREREANVKISRSLYRDNFKRFRAGKASVNDLQLDQARLLQAESQQSSGWAAVHLAFLNYCHAKGISIVSCDV